MSVGIQPSPPFCFVGWRDALRHVRGVRHSRPRRSMALQRMNSRFRCDITTAFTMFSGSFSMSARGVGQIPLSEMCPWNGHSLLWHILTWMRSSPNIVDREG